MKGISKLLILTLISTLGCSNSVSIDKYQGYVEKLLMLKAQRFKQAGYEIAIAYIPSDYYVARYYLANKKNTDKLNEIKKTYDQTFYLMVSIKNNPKEIIKESFEDINRKKNKITYNRFNRKKDMFLTHAEDTIYSSVYNYERPRNIEEDERYLISFPKEHITLDYEFIFRNENLLIGNLKIKLDDVFTKYKKLRIKEDV